MKTSLDGKNFIKNFEKCVLKTYKDSAGVLTIGYGHTRGVKPGQYISLEEAEKFFEDDIRIAEGKVNLYQEIYHFNQFQYDSLVSFAFNIGSIDKLTQYGARSISEISKKMTLYTKADGVELSGLVKRRFAEKEMFDYGTRSSNQKDEINILKEDFKMRTLRNGSIGKSVKVWQIILDIEPDGIFGPKTLKATKDFQRKNNLVVDGVVGRNTWKAALESLN